MRALQEHQEDGILRDKKPRRVWITYGTQFEKFLGGEATNVEKNGVLQRCGRGDRAGYFDTIVRAMLGAPPPASRSLLRNAECCDLLRHSVHGRFLG
jgi:hypothetical protein